MFTCKGCTHEYIIMPKFQPPRWSMFDIDKLGIQKLKFSTLLDGAKGVMYHYFMMNNRCYLFKTYNKYYFK